MNNSGQSCNAPTRMFVPRDTPRRGRGDRQGGGRGYVVGDPADPATQLGPVVSEAQFDKIQALIQTGIDEGAELVTGGPGRPGRAQPRLLRAADGVRQRHATT